MYNVQLSEFWKQRCLKETIHNAPYLFDDENESADVASVVSSRAPSQLSTTSTVTQQKVRAAAPPFALPHAPPLLSPSTPPTEILVPVLPQVEELTRKLEEERKKRVEVEQMLASFQDGGKS